MTRQVFFLVLSAVLFLIAGLCSAGWLIHNHAELVTAFICFGVSSYVASQVPG